MNVLVLVLLGLCAACTGGDVGAPCARHSDCVAPLRCSVTGSCEVAAVTTDGGVGDGDITDGDATDGDVTDAAVDGPVADAAEVDAP